MKTYIVTGATGFLGSRLVRKMLDEGCRVICIARAKGSISAEERVYKILSISEPNDSCIVIEASLSDPLLGFDENMIEQYKATGVEGIFHLAAHLSFKEKYRTEVFHTNVECLQNVIDLADTLNTQLNFVSTAYVHGTRRGIHSEDGISMPPGFNNPYEESKFEAERKIREWGNKERNKYIIFRPSIIIEDNQDYSDIPPLGFYNMVRTFFFMRHQLEGIQETKSLFKSIIKCTNGICTLPFPLIITKGSQVNLVPSSTVISWMYELAQLEDASGHAFHLVNSQSYEVRKLLEPVLQVVGLEVNIREFPSWITQSTFRIMFAFARLTSLLYRPLRIMSYYMPYINSKDIYDMSNLERLLSEEKIEFALRKSKKKGYIRDISRHFLDRHVSLNPYK